MMGTACTTAHPPVNHINAAESPGQTSSQLAAPQAGPRLHESINEEPSAKEESTTEPNPADTSFLSGTYTLIGETVDTTLRHETLSRSIENFSRRLDSFFGDTQVYEESTDTYGALRLSSRYEQGGNLTFESKFRLRLDLPHTEKRLRVRFELEDEDYDENESTATPSGTTTIGDRNVNAALQFILKEKRNWSASLSPGLRIRDPLDPYVKLRLRRSLDLMDWRSRLVQKFEWYDSTGFGTLTSVDFDHLLAKKTLLRLTTQAYRNEGEYVAKEFEVSERVAIYNALKRRLVLSSEAAIIGRTEPNWHHERYYVNLHLRRDIHKGFVFLGFVPQIDFIRDNHFRGEPSITLNLEVLYGASYLEQ